MVKNNVNQINKPINEDTVEQGKNNYLSIYLMLAKQLENENETYTSCLK